MAAEGSYHFSKKEEGKKNRKKKEKEKSAAFLAHGVVDVKVLRGKILFWAERSGDQKEDFFRSKPEGPDLDSGRGAGYLCCPFSF